jgi:hypothetical protein
MSTSRPGVLRTGCIGICLSSRWACISVPSPSPCPYADLQSFLVDLGTGRTFSCSMMHVANNGKDEFSKRTGERIAREKKWHIEEKGLECQSS